MARKVTGSCMSIGLNLMKMDLHRQASSNIHIYATYTIIYVPFPFLTYSMLSSILHKQMFEIHYFLLVPCFLAMPLQSVHAIK